MFSLFFFFFFKCKVPFILLGGDRHCESKVLCPRIQCNDSAISLRVRCTKATTSPSQAQKTTHTLNTSSGVKLPLLVWNPGFLTPRPAKNDRVFNFNCFNIVEQRNSRIAMMLTITNYSEVLYIHASSIQIKKAAGITIAWFQILQQLPLSFSHTFIFIFLDMYKIFL